MKTLYERLVEPYISDLLTELPAIAVEGLKGIGKSVSAKRLAGAIFELDQERDRELVTNDMTIISRETPPVLLDEWQRAPSVWDYVRREVDGSGNPGSFLLTGSARNTNLDIHSGAGRIYRMRMFPLSIQERGFETPTVSIGALLSSDTPFSAKISGETDVSFSKYMEEILCSGLPAIRNYSPGRRKLMLGTYLDYLLSHEFRQQGIKVRHPATLLRWLKAYAAATSGNAGYGEILDASTPGEGEKPAAKTTIAYREALENLWIIDELPMWLNGESYFARLKRSPKHYLSDPALTAYLLGLDLEMLTRPTPAAKQSSTVFDARYGGITGRLFESLIQLSLRTYASVNDAELSFFATRNQDHEVDFIVQRGDKIVAIEVKMSLAIEDNDVKHLKWLRGKLGERLTDAVVICTGPLAYRRDDGIAVVPGALLGA
jgi:predicted AAA+ superfamily ATPase